MSRHIKGSRKIHKTALNTISFLDANVCVNIPY